MKETGFDAWHGQILDFGVISSFFFLIFPTKYSVDEKIIKPKHSITIPVI
jgi:hypothetical protein